VKRPTRTISTLKRLIGVELVVRTDRVGRLRRQQESSVGPPNRAVKGSYRPRWTMIDHVWGDGDPMKAKTVVVTLPIVVLFEAILMELPAVYLAKDAIGG
jgi:hypothetical protein